MAEANAGKPFSRIREEDILYPIWNLEEIEDSPEKELVKRLKEKTLPALPEFFKMDNSYSGIPATDLFSLNTLLGSTIEHQVVQALNRQRELWDDGMWTDYHFVRHGQSFPDVRLEKHDSTQESNLGIELKSWFILSKEGEPSFRYKTAPEACSEYDLICVVPWYLDEVVSGKPIVMAPWIYGAKKASEANMYYWTYVRETKSNATIAQRGFKERTNMEVHPASKTNSNLEPLLSEKGNNFGRLSRTGLMNSYIEKILNTPLLGIPAEHWQKFFKMHADEITIINIESKLKNMVGTKRIESYKKVIEDIERILLNAPSNLIR